MFVTRVRPTFRVPFAWWLREREWGPRISSRLTSAMSGFGGIDSACSSRRPTRTGANSSCHSPVRTTERVAAVSTESEKTDRLQTVEVRSQLGRRHGAILDGFEECLEIDAVHHEIVFADGHARDEVILHPFDINKERSVVR